MAKVHITFNVTVEGNNISHQDALNAASVYLSRPKNNIEDIKIGYGETEQIVKVQITGTHAATEREDLEF